MLPNALSFAYQGIHFHLQQFANAADRISDPDSDAGIREIMEMKQAEQGVKINAAVIRKVNDMSGTLVNLLA